MVKRNKQNIEQESQPQQPKEAPNIPKVKRSLSEEERVIISKHKSKARKTIPSLLRVLEKVDEEDKQKFDSMLIDELGAQDCADTMNAHLFQASGYATLLAALTQIYQVAEINSPIDADKKRLIDEVNLSAQRMAEMGPQDPFEGQLIAQIIALHDQAMKWMKTVAHYSDERITNNAINIISKLLTRHHQAMETLMKYRRGGEQRVHVEHVHVNAGGQAIVGHVQHGGRVQPKNDQRTSC